MGECYIVPLNQIRTGSTTVSEGSGASYSVYAWFEDIDLAMPTSAPTTVPEIRAQIGSEECATTSKPVSEVASGIATTARMMGDVPVFGNAARAVDWVATAISGAASTFGWNKPTDMSKVETYAPIPAKGYTNANGIDNSVKLSAMPDNGLTYSDSVFSSKVDEMDISHVAKKSSIFADNIEWSTSSPTETNLFQFPVAPGYVQNKYVSASNVVSPSTLGYLASMFSYWRGGITYRLTVSKTAFHTGRLRVTYYAGISAGVADTATYQNAYNWVLDLSVSSEITFTVPYVANVPWKEVLIGKESDFAGKEPLMTGFITVEVLTSLRQASDSVADTVLINLWTSGYDDMAFAVPNFGSYAVYTNPFDSDDDVIPIRAQIFNETTAGTRHNEQVENDTVKVFEAPPLSLTGFEQLSVGEKITNLRQLIKRFCVMNYSLPYPYLDKSPAAYLGPINRDEGDNLFNQITLDPAYFGEASNTPDATQLLSIVVSRPSNTGIPNKSSFEAMKRFVGLHPLYRISYLFRFYRGGVRYKVVSLPSAATQCTSSATGPLSEAAAMYNSFTDSINTLPQRSELPIFAVRDDAVIQNGQIAKPVMDTFTKFNNLQRFEHSVASDLNNVLEFEVPYYNSLPISVVSEGNTSNIDGPLNRRNKIFLRRSHDPKGLDSPVTQYDKDFYGPLIYTETTTGSYGGVTRPTFGGAYIYQAAADDFSFGYLVGVPRIIKISYT